jgi:hypothetical protein
MRGHEKEWQSNKRFLPNGQGAPVRTAEDTKEEFLEEGEIGVPKWHPKESSRGRCP